MPCSGNTKTLTKALEETYEELHDDWSRNTKKSILSDIRPDGSTATTVILHAKQRFMPGRYQLTVASTGDTRCVLFPTTRTMNGWKQLTNDHTAEKPVEAMRVEMNGGTIKRQLAAVRDLYCCVPILLLHLPVEQETTRTICCATPLKCNILCCNPFKVPSHR